MLIYINLYLNNLFIFIFIKHSNKKIYIQLSAYHLAVTNTLEKTLPYFIVLVLILVITIYINLIFIGTKLVMLFNIEDESINSLISLLPSEESKKNG